MREYNEVPPVEAPAALNEWLSMILDGRKAELDESDWAPRYANVRSAASAIRQAAEKRGLKAEVAVRRDLIFVHAANGKAPTKRATKAVKAPAKAPAKRTAAAKS